MIKNMNLSRNFTVAEFERSSTAARNGLDNHMPSQYVQRAITLCEECLEPVRMKFGPVHVSSGYRGLSLNRIIGGSKNSQHTLCEAADFTVKKGTPYEVCKWIIDNGIVFDQLIHEFGQWVHISFSDRHENRMNVLTAMREDGMTVYHKGLLEV